MEFLKNFDNVFRKMVIIVIVFVIGILICSTLYDIHSYNVNLKFINNILEINTTNMPDYLDVVHMKMREYLIFRTIIEISVIVGMSSLVLICMHRVMSKMRKMIDEEQYMYDILTNISTEAIFIIDQTGKVIEANKKAKEIVNPEGFSNINIKDYLPIRLPNIEKSRTRFTSDIIEFPVEIHFNQLSINNKTHYILYLIDLTQSVQYENRLIKIADTDALTGLYNRRHFMKRMQNAMKMVKDKDEYAIFSIAMIDIDNFKCVNDQYGHDCGDSVLKEFGKVLLENTRSNDVICRIGGEEFMILMMETKESCAQEIVNRILEIFKSTKWNFDDVEISFSAGIEEVNQYNICDNPKAHIKHVDQLLYKAKKLGKGRVEIA